MYYRELSNQIMEDIVLRCVTTNYELAVAELMSLLDNSGFFAIDTEYNSELINGCALIQIAVLGTVPTIGEKRATLSRQALRPVTVFVFVVEGQNILPYCLSELLKSSMLKIGCGLTADQQRLQYYQLQLRHTIDIQDLALSLGIQKTSLENLSNKFCAQGMTKAPSPKWGRISFSDVKVIDYAAFDAYLTLEVYLQIIGYDQRCLVRALDPTLLELSDFEQWLCAQFSMLSDNKGLKISEVLTLVRNSYGGLKSEYSKSEEAAMVRVMLGQLEKLEKIRIENDLVIFSKNTTTKSLKPKSDEPSVVHRSLPKTTSAILTDGEVQFAYGRTPGTFPPGGLKVDSFIKSLINGNWLGLKIEQRYERAMFTIDHLIRKGVLRQAADKLYRNE